MESPQRVRRYLYEAILGRDWLKKKGGARKRKEYSEEMAIMVMRVGRIRKGRQRGRLVSITGEMFSESTYSKAIARARTTS
jgi:hypothetical protein